GEYRNPTTTHYIHPTCAPPRLDRPASLGFAWRLIVAALMRLFWGRQPDEPSRYERASNGVFACENRAKKMRNISPLVETHKLSRRAVDPGCRRMPEGDLRWPLPPVQGRRK